MPFLTNETSGDLNLTKLDRIYFYFLDAAALSLGDEHEPYTNIENFSLSARWMSHSEKSASILFYYFFVNPIPFKINSCFYIFFLRLLGEIENFRDDNPRQTIFLGWLVGSGAYGVRWTGHNDRGENCVREGYTIQHLGGGGWSKVEGKYMD